MSCADFRHPLQHNGTHQSERLAPELLPENLQIDDRDTKAFLNFAYEYAALLKYYNLEDVVDGDWQCFFSGGALSMLSIISAIDLAAIDDKYCRAELDFWEALEGCDIRERNAVRIARYQGLIDCIYGLACKIDQLCKQTPRSLPLKQEILDIIQQDLVQAVLENRIQNALIKLIAYDKANRPTLPTDPDQDPFLETKYAKFITTPENNSRCTQAWGIGSLDDFYCITPDDGFIEPQNPEDCKENRKLRKLFFLFFQALTKIVRRAEHHLQLELQSSNAQEPQVSLFLAFIFLFRRLIRQLNGLVGSHLDFYYQQVLCLPFKGLTPDQVYVVFELAQNFDNFQLTAQTPLDAGNDSEGNKLEYTLNRDTIVSKAKVEACEALFLKTNATGDGYDSLYSIVADQVDGVKTEAIRWERFNDAILADREGAVMGIALTDLVLNLREGTRFLVLELESSEPLPAITTPLNNLFKIYLSSPQAPDGWLEVPAANNPGPITALSVPDQGPNEGLTNNITYSRDADGNVITNSAYNNVELSSFSVRFTADNRIECRIYLSPNQPQIGLPAEGDPLFRRSLFPFVKVTFEESLASLFPIAALSNVRITTESAGVEQGIEVRNELGRFNNRDTFPLLGNAFSANLLSSGAFLEIAAEELRGKQLLGLGLEPNYVTPPDASSGSLVPLHSDLIVKGGQQRFKAKYRLVEELVSYPGAINSSVNLSLPQLPGISNFNLVLDDILVLPPLRINDDIRQQLGLSGQVTTPGSFLATGGAINIPSLGTATGLPTNLGVQGGLGGSPLFIFQNTPNFPGQFPGGFNFGGFNLNMGPCIVYSALRNRNVLTLEYQADTVTDDYFQNPDTKMVKGVGLRYASRSDFMLKRGATVYRKEEFARFHITPTGFNLINPVDPEAAFPILPQYHLLPEEEELLSDNQGRRQAVAHLYIGIRDLVPGELLSLLFEMEEGTGNSNFDPPLASWYYLAKDEHGMSDEWRPFRAGSVFLDTTSTDPDQQTSLLQSGIMMLTTSPEMTNEGTTLRPGSGLYWIRITLFEQYTPGEREGRRVIALPHIRSIRAQAAIATLNNRNNTLDHLPDGLPAETISRLVDQTPPIQAVEQPLKSINGRLPENRNAYYRRVSERLRHKNRAVNIWDYERLVLEECPEVLHAKAISHTSKDCEIETGRVMIAVFPDLKKRPDITPLTPGFSIGKLEAIEDFLREHANVFLYCNENIQVVNPIYELIRVKACVRFQPGFGPVFYATQLNQDLHNFLAPWVVDQEAPLHFSGSLHTSTILNFIEERPYVDVVSHFQVCHFTLDIETMEPVSTTGYDILGEPIPLSGELIRTRTARSILTTFPAGHDIRLWGEEGCKDCLADDFTSFEYCK